MAPSWNPNPKPGPNPVPNPSPNLNPDQERDLEWTKFTPEQLAEKNKAKTLASDIFHRKPAHELFCEEAVLRPSEGTTTADAPNPDPQALTQPQPYSSPGKFRLRDGDNREIWHAVW